MPANDLFFLPGINIIFMRDDVMNICFSLYTCSINPAVMNTISTSVTRGIKISVECEFEPLYSRPNKGYYVFSYHITIENKSNVTVKLLRRHWRIFDTLAGWSEVEGEGVVSMQPVLYPGDEYQYDSFCPLGSEAGKMQGTYLMENIDDRSTFRVKIPVFQLMAPYKTN